MSERFPLMVAEVVVRPDAAPVITVSVGAVVVKLPSAKTVAEEPVATAL
jgi:hypothetical protein